MRARLWDRSAGLAVSRAGKSAADGVGATGWRGGGIDRRARSRCALRLAKPFG